MVSSTDSPSEIGLVSGHGPSVADDRTMPGFDGDYCMAAKTNFVNLDALIPRADLAAPGDAGEDVRSLSLQGLAPKGFLYPALRKPDFQRETASWSPQQVADLVTTFVRRDLIPAVILWRGGDKVFVIDGAHRLSALVAWVHDDYGDGEVSRKFFGYEIVQEQLDAADKTRKILESSIGSYWDHQLAIEKPHKAKPEVRERATKLGWQEIDAQWIRNSAPETAEKSFFRINQGGTKIEPIEEKILLARRSSIALGARAILRSGTGHQYWDKFSADAQTEIEALGGEIYKILYSPALSHPVKTTDVPLAGHGYGASVLPFLFEFLSVVNKTHSVEDIGDDCDGSGTIGLLKNSRDISRRILSTHPSSLGLHPALYFYSYGGVFQSISFLSLAAILQEYKNSDYLKFIKARSPLEQFLYRHRGRMSEAVRKLGSGVRSRPRVQQLYTFLIEKFAEGATVASVELALSKLPDFKFMFDEPNEVDIGSQAPGSKFRRETKDAAFLRDALPSVTKCPTCNGMLHRNGMQTGHREHRRKGGTATLDNAMMQHPYCNSTVAQ